MKHAPPSPRVYDAFARRYPEIGRAWALLEEAGRQGPLDPPTVALVRLAVAVGAQKERAVRADVRRALAAGVPPAEIEQVVAVAARMLGRTGTVAVFSWVRAELDRASGTT